MRILDQKEKENFKVWIEEAKSGGAVALIDKDRDWTSFDVIGKLRPRIKMKKIGHAGTLDPLATGLLIVCFGRGATKNIDNYQALEKEYLAEVKLGATTKTDDAEGEEENLKEISHLNDEEIKEATLSFLGEIEQIPPMYSARKVDGKRLYMLARKNIEVERKSTKVTIYDIKIEKIELPYLTVRVSCSKGTYIRSLARDIGEKLGVGAYLSNLRRTKIGNYHVDDAIKIDEIISLINDYKAENNNQI